VVELSLMDTYI